MKHYKNYEEIVWGVIGAGDVCERKSAPAMNKIPHSRIKAIMRRNAEKAEDYARRHGIPVWYNQVNHLLADEEINAVYIATPPESHAELTLKAALAGKAIYVEKPMARTFEECNAMIYACRQAEVPLCVAYYRRALPKFLKLKEWLEAGHIGAVRLVQVEMIKPADTAMIARSETNWRVHPNISGGGYFHDVACHQLDVLDFLLGPILNAKGHSQNQGGLYVADDIVTASFLFENGIAGVGSWCFNASPGSDQEQTILTGSKGRIIFSTFGEGPIRLEKEGQEPLILSFKNPEHMEGPMIERMVDHLLGRGSNPCDGDTAARTSRVMDWICSD